MTPATCGGFGGVRETRTHGHLRNAAPTPRFSVASRILFLFLVAQLRESGAESPETPAPQQGQIDSQATFCHKPAGAAEESARSWSRPACQFWMFDFPPHAVPSSLVRFCGLFYSFLCSVWLCWLFGFGSWARRPVAAASLVDLLFRFSASISVVRLCEVFFPFGFLLLCCGACGMFSFVSLSRFASGFSALSSVGRLGYACSI